MNTATGLRPQQHPTTKASPRRLPARQRLRGFRALLWLGPSLVLMAAVVLYPVIALIQSSLTRYNGFGLPKGFAALDNFQRLFDEPALGSVIWNTMRWVAVVVGGTVIISLFLAKFLSSHFTGRRLVRWILLLPWAASLVMTSVVWRYVYDELYGYLNRVLLDLHLIDAPVAWTIDPQLRPWSLALVGVVVSVPFTTYVLLAGLQSIGHEVYEAASLDGAGPVQTYLRITLPMLRPALSIAIVLNTIYVFSSFPIIWVLTGNQPGYGADTLITFMYKLAFKTNLDIGESSALAVFNLAFTLGLALLSLRLTESETEAPTAGKGRLRRAIKRVAPVVARPSRTRQRAHRPVWDVTIPAWWPAARRFLLPVVGVLVGLIFLMPYLVMFLSSLKSDQDLFSSPARYLPSHWLWDNWPAAFRQGDLLTYFRNSLIVSVGSTLLVLAVAIPAAYYTSRNRFKGRGAFLKLVLITQMFAPISLVIGIYREWQQLGMSNTLTALILTDAGFNLAFAVWILNTFFSSIPQEIDEAARMDGLPDLQVLWRVVLPLARPGLVTATIFTFIAVWNEFVVALTITSTTDTKPLTVGINDFIGQYQVHYQYIFVASLVAIIPVVALFAVIERHLVSGLTAGAVK
ncbi:ABC transporter permease subunit [Streptomyces sp. NPDC005799]|uniref:ABC transporter permease n=1 Tax=Streptomyces sp. NPDC005799 TaxID=3154678 RepID=UPI0033E57BCF